MCPAATTTFPLVPAARWAPILVELAVTLAAIEHCGECGSCTVAGVLRKGSPWLHAAVDRIVRGAVERAVGGAVGQRLPANRRN